MVQKFCGSLDFIIGKTFAFLLNKSLKFASIDIYNSMENLHDSITLKHSHIVAVNPVS